MDESALAGVGRRAWRPTSASNRPSTSTRSSTWRPTPPTASCGPAAPLTTYLVGVAVGRPGETPTGSPRCSEHVRAAIEAWDAPDP